VNRALVLVLILFSSFQAPPQDPGYIETGTILPDAPHPSHFYITGN
jgi:hypothetical protein